MDNNTNTTYILSKSQLEDILKSAFSGGAISYSKWSGQSDTCWSNVNLDMLEDVECLIKGLEE